MKSLKDLASKLKAFGKSKAKQATGGVTNLFKHFKANDFANAINTVAGKNSKKEMFDEIDKSLTFKHYIAKTDTAKKAYNKSSVAGAMLAELKEYLNPSNQGENTSKQKPEWLNCTNPDDLKIKLKKLYKAAGSNVTEESSTQAAEAGNATQEQWIASVLYNKKVRNAICKLSENITKIEDNNSQSAPPKKTPPPVPANPKPYRPLNIIKEAPASQTFPAPTPQAAASDNKQPPILPPPPLPNANTPQGQAADASTRLAPPNKPLPPVPAPQEKATETHAAAASPRPAPPKFRPQPRTNTTEPQAAAASPRPAPPKFRPQPRTNTPQGQAADASPRPAPPKFRPQPRTNTPQGQAADASPRPALPKTRPPQRTNTTEPQAAAASPRPALPKTRPPQRTNTPQDQAADASNRPAKPNRPPLPPRNINRIKAIIEQISSNADKFEDKSNIKTIKENIELMEGYLSPGYSEKLNANFEQIYAGLNTCAKQKTPDTMNRQILELLHIIDPGKFHRPTMPIPLVPQKPSTPPPTVRPAAEKTGSERPQRPQSAPPATGTPQKNSKNANFLDQIKNGDVTLKNVPERPASAPPAKQSENDLTRMLKEAMAGRRSAVEDDPDDDDDDEWQD